LPQQALPARTGLGLQKGVFAPRARVIDVEVGRNHIEVASHDDRMRDRMQRCSVGDESLEPLELVVELWPRLGIAVREIQAADNDATYGSL